MVQIRVSDLTAPFYVQLKQVNTQDANQDNFSSSLNSQFTAFKEKTLLIYGDSSFTDNACILLCCVADDYLLEKVGVNWTQYSLLVKYFNNPRISSECWKNYLNLIGECTRSKNEKQIQLLQLFEQALTLGWKGDYKLLPDCDSKIEKLRLSVHSLIYDYDIEREFINGLIDSSVRHLNRRNKYIIYIFFLVIVFAGLSMYLLTDSLINSKWQDVTDEASRKFIAPNFLE